MGRLGWPDWNLWAVGQITPVPRGATLEASVGSSCCLMEQRHPRGRGQE